MIQFSVKHEQNVGELMDVFFDSLGLLWDLVTFEGVCGILEGGCLGA